MVKDFLSSHKRIYDAVHGFIRFDEFERKLIDSLPFQRLHYIHQLGIGYLVYPGATHTRFEHSLGVMVLATRMYNRICKSVRPDVFHFIPRKGSAEFIYWKKVLRLAALCHDLGHLPFSHSTEEELLKDEGHEKITVDIIKSEYMEDVWNKIKQRPSIQRGLNRDIREDVIKLAIGEEKLQEIYKGKYPYSFTSWETILSQIIIGNFFGADRIDYLLRDAKSTGIVYGLFDYLQLIEMLRILPSPNNKEGVLELGIDENGIESCEALLLARHFMHRRVYQYPSIRAYNFHLSRFMNNAYISQKILTDINYFIHTNDADVIFLLSKASKDKNHPGHEDAKRIILRKERFKAIALPSEIKDDTFLKEFKYKNHIEDDKIHWEFQKAHKELDLSFPVARRHLTVQKAKNCSSLLRLIPSSSNNWLYISPEYELLFLETLKEN